MTFANIDPISDAKKAIRSNKITPTNADSSKLNEKSKRDSLASQLMKLKI